MCTGINETEGVQLNQSEIASALGVSRDRVRDAISRHSLQPVAKNKNTKVYQLSVIAPYVVKPHKDNGKVDLMGFDNAGEYKSYMQAEQIKLAIMREAGELIPIAEVQATVGRIIAGLKQFKDACISRVEEAIPNAEPQQLDTLDELLDYDLKSAHNDIEAV